MKSLTNLIKFNIFFIVLYSRNGICDLTSDIKIPHHTIQEESYRTLNKSFGNLVSLKLKDLEIKNNWQIIDLSHNSIEFIDRPELLEKQNELEFLQIDFNMEFNVRKDETILTNKNLKRMSCKGCGFTEIHSQHFTGIDKLTELNLSANKIVRIDAGAFKTNGYLKVVNLSDNKIIKLSPSTFSSLRRFEELTLSSNPIELTPHKPILKSESVRRLILENCQLNYIHKETFNELVGIELINLNHNRIEEVEVASFTLNVKLRSLFIENNFLKFFPASILDSTKKLEELCVDKNPYEGTPEFYEFVKRYSRQKLRTENCSSDLDSFVENILLTENVENGIELNSNNSTNEKFLKFLKLNEGISNFFIGSYLTIILLMQAVAFILLSFFLLKIIRYEKLGTGKDVNYANTILNNNDIFKVYKLDE